MLYEPSKQTILTPELFKNPTNEFRGAPFWSWNCELDEKELLWQIDVLHQMGMGGFHIHARTGMATPYLSDEFMTLVRACMEKGKENAMYTWLYDEDRWPSGVAGGFVTEDRSLGQQYLRFSPMAMEGKGTILARYAVELNADGTLAGYRRYDATEPIAAEITEQTEVYAAELLYSEPEVRYNHQPYVNTLNKKAIERFVELTHERYRQAVGDEFGKAVPAIFTDEPQFLRKTMLRTAFEKTALTLPWTADLGQTYWAAFGDDLLDRLPELFWELPDGQRSATRYRYHEHLAERFADAFADTCGQWCAQNGIMLTGHMMAEPTLQSQTLMLGEAMRSYRAFQLPGIDMLCDLREYTTAKQAQSAARQYGREGVMSELYGVTNWDFDFRGHKLQGDWQAAMGVTLRVHHLSWVSMEGEAKRDYPASISYQSPWHQRYRYIEDHFARVNTALTRGTPMVRVGVIHPIESYWMYFGPQQQTAGKRAELDRRFAEVTDWLSFGLVDFDFICESLLPSQCDQGGAPLRVGEMAYDAIVVPACETLRASTVARLEAFASQGGRLIIMGARATHMDAIPSGCPAEALTLGQCIDWSQTALLDALAPIRLIDAYDAQGMRTQHLLYQMRRDGDKQWLFVCNGRAVKHPDVLQPQSITLSIKGDWSPVLYDTLTGDIRPLQSTASHGGTTITTTLHAHDSLLLQLAPRTAGMDGAMEAKPYHKFAGAPYTAVCDISLSEPNVCLLDRAEYRFGDEDAWQPAQELLRIDNAYRERLGMPLRQAKLAQPWAEPDPGKAHPLWLRFEVACAQSLEGLQLALEHPERASLFVDGQRIASDVTGWFVDKSIQTVSLPKLNSGLHAIEVRMSIDLRVGAEWCYLLGDFGVSVQGVRKVLGAPVRRLGFGDAASQGLPFYCGNITYHIPVATAGQLRVEASHYRGTLLGMAMDGGEERPLAFAPYQMTFSGLEPGAHMLDITVYGNRHNGFGPLHNADETLAWVGPNAWRSQGAAWCEEYRLKPFGLLTGPRLEADNGY